MVQYNTYHKVLSNSPIIDYGFLLMKQFFYDSPHNPGNIWSLFIAFTKQALTGLLSQILSYTYLSQGKPCLACLDSIHHKGLNNIYMEIVPKFTQSPFRQSWYKSGCKGRRLLCAVAPFSPSRILTGVPSRSSNVVGEEKTTKPLYNHLKAPPRNLLLLWHIFLFGQKSAPTQYPK